MLLKVACSLFNSLHHHHPRKWNNILIPEKPFLVKFPIKTFAPKKFNKNILSDMFNAIVTHFSIQGLAFQLIFLPWPRLTRTIAPSREGSSEVSSFWSVCSHVREQCSAGQLWPNRESNSQPQIIHSSSHPVAGLQACATKHDRFPTTFRKKILKTFPDSCQ